MDPVLNGFLSTYATDDRRYSSLSIWCMDTFRSWRAWTSLYFDLSLWLHRLLYSLINAEHSSYLPLGDEVHMVVHQAERQYRHIEFQGTYRYAVHSVYVVSPVSEKEFLFKAFSAYMVVFSTLSPHVHSLSPVDFLLQISLLSEVNSIDLFRKFDLRSVAVSIFQNVKELIVFALSRSSRLCRDRISFSGPIALS